MTKQRPKKVNKGIGIGRSFYIPNDKVAVYEEFVENCEKSQLNLNRGIVLAMEVFNTLRREQH